MLADLREEVRHLQRGAHGVGALVEARLGLLGRVHREDAERDGNAGLQAGELEARSSLARDAGINNIGNSAGSPSDHSRAGLFDSASKDDHDDMDMDSDEFSGGDSDNA